MVPGYELLKEVRGKGLMIGIEFGPPKSLRLKASWNVLETANKGLFCQLITLPLFNDHKILTQVSGHGSHTIKLVAAADHHRRRLQLDRGGLRSTSSVATIQNGRCSPVLAAVANRSTSA
jgi:acetylornithine/succinyldiaminopimelate/putrescine aminotransferase